MDTSVFEELGLTQAEIKTYMTLLELGPTTAGPILEKSGVQNSVIHRALHTLIEKGLVSYVLEGKRRTYQATDPDNFHAFMDDKRKRFDAILPELKQKQKYAASHESATIYKGIRGLTEIYRILVSQEEHGIQFIRRRAGMRQQDGNAVVAQHTREAR